MFRASGVQWLKVEKKLANNSINRTIWREEVNSGRYFYSQFRHPQRAKLAVNAVSRLR